MHSLSWSEVQGNKKQLNTTTLASCSRQFCACQRRGFLMIWPSCLTPPTRSRFSCSTLCNSP